MNTLDPTSVQLQKMTSNAIAAVVLHNKNAVIALLKKNGVNVDGSYSDKELIVGILAAARSNARFRGELRQLMTNTMLEHKSGFTGDGFFNAMGGETNPLQTATVPSTSTSTGSSASSFFNSTNLNKLFDTGLNILSTSLQNKSNKQLADTALQIEQEKTKQAALLAANKGNATGTTGGLSTGAKIGIGIAITGLLVLLLWVIFKKKK
jgi:hypothetical protein